MNSRGKGLQELSRAVALPRQTTYRLVRTLVELGWAQREPTTDTYSLTSRVWSLGVRSFQLTDARDELSPAVHQLADEYGETVHLGAYESGYVVYIDKADGSDPIRAYSQLGGRAPAYCVATGKALLAYQPDHERDQVMSHLSAHSPRTIVDPDKMSAELDQIRQRGYAINSGEWRATVGGIAVALRDPSGQVVAGLGFSGPVERIIDRKQTLLDALTLAVTEHRGALMLAADNLQTRIHE